MYAKDPTRPLLPNHKSGSTEKPKSAPAKQPLTAVITRNNQRFAIIEGKSYRTGDYYRGNRIVNIFKDRVLLNSSSGNIQLTFIPKIKK